jgi:hypothetical protein
MLKIKTLLALFVLFLGVSGCFAQTRTIGDSAFLHNMMDKDLFLNLILLMLRNMKSRLFILKLIVII